MSLREELEQHLSHMSANDPDTMRDLPSAITGAQWMAERCAEMCKHSTSNGNDVYRMGALFEEMARDLRWSK